VTWFIMLAYLALQLGIGVWVSRRVRSESDYFLAGRKLGLPLVTVSLFATWFGAETCIGSAGLVYSDGLSGGRADPLGYSLCLLLSGLLLAKPLWGRSFFTLGDLYRQRYSPTVERVSVWLLVPSSVLWGAAQIRAFGQVVAFSTSLPVDLAITVSAAFVLAYTYSGGILADVVTDLVQGGILAVGLFVLLALCLFELGGPSGFVAAIEPARLSLVRPDESWLMQVDRWAVPALGSIVAQELVSRGLSAKSAKVAQHSSFYACALYLLVGSVPVLLGLAGPTLVPDLAEPEQFLPALASKYLSPVMFALLSAALMSAILSTVDSVFLAIGALMSHNLLLPVFGWTSERARLRSARGSVIAGALVAYVLALHADGIYSLIESSATFGAAGILVTTLAGVYAKIGGPAAALAAMITGLVVTPLAEHVLELDAPFLCAMLAAVVAYFGVALVERRLAAPASRVEPAL
jgi:solute:Na+ symporter, SSS family